MAASKPVDLCTHLMPSGKLCRGIALRGQRHCHAHIGNHYHLTKRERGQFEALSRLADQLQGMGYLDLLYTLQAKLCSIQSILLPYAEAKLTLHYVLNYVQNLYESAYKLDPSFAKMINEPLLTSAGSKARPASPMEPVN